MTNRRGAGAQPNSLPAGDGATAGAKAPWTFLTNHGHVVVCLLQDPEMRLSEMARRVAIGERAVHRIVQDLVDAGYVSRSKVGRRNRYELHLDRALRHPLEADHQLIEVFGALAPGPRRRSARRG